MKLSCAAALLLAVSAGSALAFLPVAVVRSKTTSALAMGTSGMDLSGNSWKPDSEKMGSTDYGDYFPEGYDRNAVAFTEGMMGSQGTTGDRKGPQLPGLENLGADAIVAGGINLSPDIPAGMQFIPSSVPDGEYTMNVASSGSGETLTIAVKPVCMTYEDYFAAFSADSHPSFSVVPATGRMDRRGGEPSQMRVTCDPKGAAGDLIGNLVINLPEDNSKICYKVIAKSF